MPQRQSAIKALRINRKRQMHNLDIKTDLKKTIKKFQALIVQKNKEEAKSMLKTVFQRIDKAAKRNILHKNTAARRKSRFSRLLSTLG